MSRLEIFTPVRAKRSWSFSKNSTPGARPSSRSPIRRKTLPTEIASFNCATAGSSRITQIVKSYVRLFFSGRARRPSSVVQRQSILLPTSRATRQRRIDRSQGERSKQQLRYWQYSDRSGLRRSKSRAKVIRANGRVPKWVHNQCHLQRQSAALYRRLRHGRFLQDHWRFAGLGPRFHGG